MVSVGCFAHVPSNPGGRRLATGAGSGSRGDVGATPRTAARSLAESPAGWTAPSAPRGRGRARPASLLPAPIRPRQPRPRAPVPSRRPRPRARPTLPLVGLRPSRCLSRLPRRPLARPGPPRKFEKKKVLWADGRGRSARAKGRAGGAAPGGREGRRQRDSRAAEPGLRALYTFLPPAPAAPGAAMTVSAPQQPPRRLSDCPSQPLLPGSAVLTPGGVSAGDRPTCLTFPGREPGRTRGSGNVPARAPASSLAGPVTDRLGVVLSADLTRFPQTADP